MSPSSTTADHTVATMSGLPAVGTRFALSGYIGTIRYVGEVDGTSGTWLGVEWDDRNRGKHDGIKDGKRYFSCLEPGAGSFIRPLSSLQFRGQTFLCALINKYVEQLHGPNTRETVVLGSSNGAIQVEAVNLDKIRGKFSDLERLQEVSLDKEAVSQADPPGEIRKKCPNVRGVDLSYSLISSWDVVALIVIELPILERLSLNNNRLQPPSISKLGRDAFSHLTELQLNGTLMSWQAIMGVVTLMPRLQRLESGYNRLLNLSSSPQNHPEPVITTLNLDSNDLFNWAETCRELVSFHKLVRLVLSSNSYESIPVPGGPYVPLKLTHLSLSLTRITEWSSVDSLNLWCPELESLSLNGTPLIEGAASGRWSDPPSSYPQVDRVWQQLVIARLPRLRFLDGTSISQRQRVDAELLYVSRTAREHFPSDAARATAHPRWAELCKVHGTPDMTSEKKGKDDTLKNHLIEIKASFSAVSPPPSTTKILALTRVVKVLPSTPLRILRLKLLKLFKAPRGTEGELWMRMADGRLVPLGDIRGVDEDKDIDWWLESGSEVVLCTKN